MAIIAGAVLAPIVALTATAPFGPIDDYEIVAYSRGIVPTFIEENRFRPLYYLLRWGETGLWSTNPAGWGLDRFLLGVLTVALAFAIARRWVSAPISLLASLLVVLGPQSEVFYRFGPQESYAMPMLLGAILAVLTGRFGIGLALAIAAALTKEVFIPAAALVVGFSWLRGARWQAIVGGAVVTVAGVWVVYLALVHPLAELGFAGRYLLPAILVPLGIVVIAARRWPWLRYGMAMDVGLAFAVAVGGATTWAQQNRDWQAYLATFGPERPIVIRVTVDQYEQAFALRTYLGGDVIFDVEPCSGALCEALRASRTGTTPR